MLARYLQLAIIVSAAILQLVAAAELTCDDDLSCVKLNCTNKLNFKSIHEFKAFMGPYKRVASRRAGHEKSVAECLAGAEALVALEKLVDNYDRKRPCKFSEVAKLEDYAKKYLLEEKKSVALRFFTLFGLNVSINCKIKLLAHIRQADTEADQLDFIYSMASPTGWNVLINEVTKKSMKFGASGNAGNTIINRIAKLVPGLVRIDQLNYLNFAHPRNVKTVDKEIGAYKLRSAKSAGSIEESLNRIIKSCRDLDQLYVNSILSLARLNSLGLTSDVLNEQHESSLMLHRWLAVASFCQLMVRVNVSKSAEFINYEIIHDDNLLESRRKLYSYVAEFEEMDELANESVWQVSVLEGKWRRKGEAMFKPGNEMSVAGQQLVQFIRGVERDFEQGP